MKAEDLPWLAEPARRAREALERGRLGHGILVVGAPGLGPQVFARWLAQMALCDADARRPCGACSSCQLWNAGNHPDYLEVQREEDATQLKVEQVRDLCEALSFKSYRGGYKVAVIAEADAMNANAANALLKTLEEPPPSTILVLCSARPSRLPATIVSRCQRIDIPQPPTGEALAWLSARKSLQQWPTLLEYAAGAPLRAMELEAAGFLELDEDMRNVVERLAARSLNIQSTAERWHKAGLDLRLAWLDTWIARRVRHAVAPAAHLPPGSEIRNISGLFDLLDRVRAFKLELDTSLNKQLATEELLMRAEAALAAASA
jgi:DNA polymerase-3 subunit delta'